MAKKNREEIPELWSPPGWYASGQSSPISEGIYYPDGILLEPARTEYWLFPHDAEIMLGIGIASWAFDVIWTARKGSVNNRVMKSIPGQTALVPVQGGMMLAYRLQF
jgi:hypothetical protein